jgi:hypothetical protein
VGCVHAHVAADAVAQALSGVGLQHGVDHVRETAAVQGWDGPPRLT